jgi:hypothetical protein
MYVQVELLESFKNMLTTTWVIRMSDEVAIWFHIFMSSYVNTLCSGVNKLHEVGVFLRLGKVYVICGNCLYESMQERGICLKVQ